MSNLILTNVMERSPARGAQRLVMFVLADMASDDGLCWPSVDLISRLSGVTRRGVFRALNELEEAGELEVGTRVRVNGSLRSSTYLLAKYARGGSDDLSRGVVTPRHGGGDALSRGVVTPCHDLNPHIEPSSEPSHRTETPVAVPATEKWGPWYDELATLTSADVGKRNGGYQGWASGLLGAIGTVIAQNEGDRSSLDLHIAALQTWVEHDEYRPARPDQWPMRFRAWAQREAWRIPWHVARTGGGESSPLTEDEIRARQALAARRGYRLDEHNEFVED